MKTLILFILLPCFVACQSQRTELEKLFFAGKYDEVIQHAESVLQLNPNDIEANSFLGQSLLQQKSFSMSLKYLNKADELEHDNHARKLWIVLNKGIAHYFLDNYSTAQDCISKCFELNSTPSGMQEVKRTAINLGFKEYYKNWTLLETEHFRFHFPKDSNIGDKHAFAEEYESAYEHIQSFFCSKIPKRIEAIIWNSVKDAQELGIESLAFARPSFVVLHTKKDNTIGHEMTHIISKFASPDSAERNDFVFEGTAVYFDQSTESKIERARFVKNQNNYNSKINLKKVWQNPKEYPEWIIYLVSSEVMKQLIENYGRDKFIQLLQNQSYESALSIYGNSLTEILAEVENKIN